MEQILAGLAARCATSGDCRAVQAALLALLRRGLVPDGHARRWMTHLELQKDEHIALQMDEEEGGSGRGDRPAAARRAAAAAAAAAEAAFRVIDAFPVAGRRPGARAQGAAAAGRVHPRVVAPERRRPEAPPQPVIAVKRRHRIQLAAYNALDAAALVRKLSVLSQPYTIISLFRCQQQLSHRFSLNPPHARRSCRLRSSSWPSVFLALSIIGRSHAT